MSGTYGVFDTSYAKTNQDTLRWASVAIAAVLFLCCLIAGVVIYTRQKFKDDLTLRATNAVIIEEGTGVTEKSTTKWWFALIMISFFWLVTLVSTFLSWYVASLHMQKNNLIALDVLNVVIFIMLGLAAYFYYNNVDSTNRLSRTLIGSSLVLEFIVLILMMVSVSASGSDGILTQSALYVPLLVSTFVMMN